MPRVLFVHNGSPGRFLFVAEALRARGWTGALINGDTGTDLPGFETRQWQPGEAPAPTDGRALRHIKVRLDGGLATARVAEQLRVEGFRPDVIIGHPGWGEMVFLGEVFPGVPQIHVGEYYYRSRNSDVDFDPEFPQPDLERRMGVEALNFTLAASYANAAAIVVPTEYQKSTIPETFHARIRVIHEGIETGRVRARDNASLTFQNGLVLDRSTPVVTFINRRLEPLRGFHIFMRALPALLAARPDVHVIVTGSDKVGGYGLQAPAGSSWGQWMIDQVGSRIDRSRVHFTGTVPHSTLLDIFSISAAHVYMTYPFVLSWSLLDAMACECLVVGSDTAPVREVITHGANGLLFDFFDVEGLARTLVTAVEQPSAYRSLRQAARQTVIDRFDRDRVCTPAWISLVEEVAADGGRG